MIRLTKLRIFRRFRSNRAVQTTVSPDKGQVRVKPRAKPPATSLAMAGLFPAIHALAYHMTLTEDCVRGG